ncbi:acyl carrier protein [Nocardia terpenica]|uniref:Carrier domain-containing protein n=1 Tax=Nocardia terpenica TaxID=455432 RepID=A0A164P021_9NOCA|nr:acyl carrier protein [Nocardia terpenica]KZM74937.1 hypothetical protein AWN90_23275 [Nocardia terpenica]NQE93400.1 acyl carrier protein [Nocardia terpenica]
MRTNGIPDELNPASAGRAEFLLTVRELIAANLGLEPAGVPPDAHLFELPGVDSLKLVQGLVAIEQRLGLVLDEDVAIGVRTVADLADVLWQANSHL